MKVMTVTGPRDLATLEFILPHEHVLLDYGEIEGEPTPLAPAERAAITCALARLRESGADAFVDCTPPSYGLDPPLLAELSAETGLAIVISTGSFCEQWAPQPPHIATADADQLCERFVGELIEGLGETGVRAGVIKTATSEGAIRPNEEKLLRAAARTQRRTGASIVSHTTAGLGLEQLDIFEAEGADPTRILISHVGFEPDPEPYAIEIARRGAYVGLDRIGHAHFHPPEHWLRLTRVLAEAGQLGQVLLSQDSVQRFVGPDAIKAHTFSEPWYLASTFLDRLASMGFTQADVRRLVRENPRAWLGEAG